MRISDWSSDLCSSDLLGFDLRVRSVAFAEIGVGFIFTLRRAVVDDFAVTPYATDAGNRPFAQQQREAACVGVCRGLRPAALRTLRSEEHTSELQSLMRSSYAVFCLKKISRLEKVSFITDYTP